MASDCFPSRTFCGHFSKYSSWGIQRDYGNVLCFTGARPTRAKKKHTTSNTIIFLPITHFSSFNALYTFPGHPQCHAKTPSSSADSC